MENLKHIRIYENFVTNKINEMALSDVNVQRILSIFDLSDSSEKQRISDVISGFPHEDRKTLENDFKEIGYEQLIDMMMELNLLPE